jgi:hypothetical protein
MPETILEAAMDFLIKSEGTGFVAGGLMALMLVVAVFVVATAL